MFCCSLLSRFIFSNSLLLSPARQGATKRSHSSEFSVDTMFALLIYPDFHPSSAETVSSSTRTHFWRRKIIGVFWRGPSSYFLPLSRGTSIVFTPVESHSHWSLLGLLSAIPAAGSMSKSILSVSAPSLRCYGKRNRCLDAIVTKIGNICYLGTSRIQRIKSKIPALFATINCE